MGVSEILLITFCLGDDFYHKREILEAIATTKHYREENTLLLQYLVIAIRLMIERGIILEARGQPERLMGQAEYSEGDLEFWAYHLSYYRH
jgi:hypothetical protein